MDDSAANLCDIRRILQIRRAASASIRSQGSSNQPPVRKDASVAGFISFDIVDALTLPDRIELSC